MTKLDSNLAWQEASAAVSANREVLAVLAGVFFLLPRLAVELLGPVPPNMQALGVAELQGAMRDFYLQMLPLALPMMAMQFVGTQAMLTLFTDRTRPTVAEAIGQGLIGALCYLAAQLLFAATLGVAGGLLIGIAGMLGLKPLVALMVVVVLAAIGYMALRLVLLGPVIAVERVRNPLHAIPRAWALAQGNVRRIFVLVALMMIVLMVIMMAGAAVIGGGAALIFGATVGRIAGAVVNGLAGAVFAVYFAGILAAIHRQLAGPSLGAVTAPFE